MATVEILDFERLLKPISAERPSGVELKTDPATFQSLYLVRGYRNTAREAERKLVTNSPDDSPGRRGDNESDPAKVAPLNWKLVMELAQQLIAEKSKDLTIAGYLIEALARRNGFAGLRDGFRLAREICTRFWDGIHPAPDQEEGYGITVNHFVSLNGQDGEGALIAPIANIELCELSSGHRILGSDFFYALESSHTFIDKNRREQLRAAIDQAKREVSKERLTETKEDISAALAEFDKLTKVFDDKCLPHNGQPTSPPSTQIRDQLQRSVERVDQLLGISGEKPLETTSTGDAATSSSPAKSTSTLPLGSLQSREDAFKSLATVAIFFRRTEPHSPVSYALEQVVRWGQMSLPELLRELISDEVTRTDLAKRTGIPIVPPAEKEKD